MIINYKDRMINTIYSSKFFSRIELMFPSLFPKNTELLFRLSRNANKNLRNQPTKPLYECNKYTNNSLIKSYIEKHPLRFNITDCKKIIKSIAKKLKKVIPSVINFLLKQITIELIKEKLPDIISYLFSDTDTEDNNYTPCMIY